MKIIENRKIWFLISLVIIVAGLISLIFRGLNFDIEFAGGTIIQIDMHQKLNDPSELSDIVKEISGDSNPQIQAVSGAAGSLPRQRGFRILALRRRSGDAPCHRRGDREHPRHDRFRRDGKARA